MSTPNILRSCLAPSSRETGPVYPALTRTHLHILPVVLLPPRKIKLPTKYRHSKRSRTPTEQHQRHDDFPLKTHSHPTSRLVQSNLSECSFVPLSIRMDSYSLCRTRHNRHSCAVNMLARGLSASDVKNRLGHDNLQSTMTYLHMDLNLRRHIQKRYINYMQSVRKAGIRIPALPGKWLAKQIVSAQFERCEWCEAE
jgi:hypothetical protein